jgi:pilus assembly protein Flp/PilA
LFKGIEVSYGLGSCLGAKIRGTGSPSANEWRQDMKKMFRIFKNEEGATAIEYGLIAALIAVAAIVAMGQVGGALTGTFTDVAEKLEAAPTEGGEI